MAGIGQELTLNASHSSKDFASIISFLYSLILLITSSYSNQQGYHQLIAEEMAAQCQASLNSLLATGAVSVTAGPQKAPTKHSGCWASASYHLIPTSPPGWGSQWPLSTDEGTCTAKRNTLERN